MFPLLERDRANPAELFQIWLNLPRAGKLVPPYFTMQWREQIPRVVRDGVELTVIAGQVGDTVALAPPPDSWAARDAADVAIWTLRLQPGARTALPSARAGTNRMVYVFRGTARIAGQVIRERAVQVVPDAELAVEAVEEVVEVLVLQGRPIGEPVVQHGPFVMNSRAEIEQAFADYRRTQFGGWPWPADDPVHGVRTRFAKHPDGRTEEPDQKQPDQKQPDQKQPDQKQSSPEVYATPIRVDSADSRP